MISSKDALAFCDRWLSAWRGNRPEHLLTFYTADALYRDPARPESLRGHAELLPYFQKLLARNPDWRWRAVEVFPTERGFTLKWQAEIPLGRATITELGVDIIELRGGEICRNEVYFDRVNWVRALASSGETPGPEQ